LPALANQFISIVKDSSLVYFLGLLTSQRDLFTIGQNTSVNTANLSPLVAAGVVYLLITVPLTHAINHIDRWTNRHANPRQGGAGRGATRRQREAQASAAEAVIAEQPH
jgi:polar amino acid transport system permease protein